ncbi:hypothetical protein L218DRAFT_254584 [Marasmius fiardii PR-910]|nr:hypothetical protein L218DRAFT_254584 [Marasmius fiardii PR-910]
MSVSPIQSMGWIGTYKGLAFSYRKTSPHSLNLDSLDGVAPSFLPFFLAFVVVCISSATNVHGSLVARAFKELPYAQFQISDGTAGQAEAKANAVCVDPFQGQDLATVDAASLKALSDMRVAAEDAETSLFNPAIDKASADALQNGKIQNKVLKLTCETQVLKIQLAQAKTGDTASIQSKLDEEQTKLNTNIATDKKNAGAASQGVA